MKGYRGRFWFLLIAFSGVYEVAAANDAALMEYLFTAKQHVRFGDYAPAAIEFGNALRVDPESLEARIGLGRVRLRLHDYPGAAKELEKALALGGSRSALVLDLAEAWLAARQFRPLLDRLSTDPSDDSELATSILRARGLAHLALGEEEAAARAFRSALERDPEDSLSMVCMAQYAMARGDVVDARLWLGKAFARDPDSLAATLTSGRLRLHQGDYTGARQAIRRVLAARPDYTPAILAGAEIEIHLNQLEQARTLLASIPAEVAEGLVEFDFVSGLLALRGGDLQQAAERAARVLMRTSSHPGALLLAAVANRDTGANEMAYHRTRRFLEFDPTNELALRLKAELERRLGITEQAGSEAGEALNHAAGAARFTNGSAFNAALQAIRLGDQQRALDTVRALSIEYPDQAQVWHLRGVAEGVAGRWDDARTSLRRAALMAPDYRSVQADQAALELASDNPGEARRIYENLLDRQPDSVVALLGIAELEARESGVDAALVWIEKARRSHPDDSAPVLAEGWALFLDGRHEQAAHALRPMERLDSDHPAYLELAGHLAAARSDSVRATRAFERLARRLPDSARAYALFGRSLLESGQPEQASGALGAAWDLDRDDLPTAMLLVDALLRSERVRGALAVIRELRRTRSQDSRLLLMQADLLERIGERDDAIGTYRLVLAVGGGLDPTIRTAIEAMIRLGAAQRVVGSLRGRLKQPEQSASVYRLLADVLVMSGRWKEAEQAYRHALESYPEDFALLNNLALAEFRGGDSARALRTAKQALDLAPGNPAVLDTVGWILVSADRALEALPHLREAANLLPGQAEIQFHLGMAMAEIGDLAGAQLRLSLVASGSSSYRVKAQATLGELQR